MIGQSATPVVTDKILKILRIYPPYSADADGLQLTTADEATYRPLRVVQDLRCARDAEQGLQRPRARRSAGRFRGRRLPRSRSIPLGGLHATALPLSSPAWSDVRHQRHSPRTQPCTHSPASELAPIVRDVQQFGRRCASGTGRMHAPVRERRGLIF